MIRFSIFVLGMTLALSLSGESGAAITFVPGHTYATQYSSNTIQQYDANGTVVGSASAPGETRGVAFGDDGLLYTTILPAAPAWGFTVRAFDASMNAVHTFTNASTYMHGNTTYGRLALDANYVYVAGQGILHRFDRSNPTAPAVSIYNGNQVHDVETLPNGNLLVLEAYEVREITPSGSFVREINYGFTDNRSVEYDPGTNSVFVSHFGNTGSPIELMRFDYASFAYTGGSTAMALDLFVTADGKLLANGAGPRVFNMNMELIDTFDGGGRTFVTQMVVPEPSGLAALTVMGACLLVRRRCRA
jgi:hypothetical protein